MRLHVPLLTFTIDHQSKYVLVTVEPASYPMGTRGSFPGGKAAEAWSWTFISI